MSDHEHVIDTGKGTFSLDELGHLMPGMAEIMPLVGSRIWKCYYAGKAGNRPLAAFQLKEAVNLMEKGAFLRPTLPSRKVLQSKFPRRKSQEEARSDFSPTWRNSASPTS